MRHDRRLWLELCGRDRRRSLAELVMDDKGENESAGEGCASGDEDLREREPAAAWGFGCGRCGDGGVGLLGEEDDLAAISAGGEMR